MKDFFISYNKADRQWAEWIAWALKEQGKQVVIQAWHFGPGCNFPLEMHKAIRESEKILLVLSPDFLTSEFTSPEWSAFFAQDPTGALRKIMPVRVRDCRPDGLLGPISYIDLLGASPEAEAQRMLIDGLLNFGEPSTAPSFPGAQVCTATTATGPKPPFPVFSVPHQRNPNFSGREDYLAALGTALAGGPAALTQQAIAGLGGVGKTQLALEYCYRRRGDYPLIWWVRCEEPATLASDYAGLAPHLGIPPNPDQTQTVAAVRAWLAAHPGWLLVLDNVEKPEDLRDYLPQGGQGHVLITSREDMSDIASTMDVTVWPEDEAIAFLLKRTGEKDQEAAKVLATELGRLPLALEQAGAYIKKSGCGVSGYLDMLKDNLPKLMEWGKGLSGYEKNVATTWLPAFAEVQKKSPAAAELLNLCAFLAPDDIPLEIIKEGKEFLPPALAGAVDDPLPWNEALAALKAYSLVQREGDSLSVHRLVQAVTRDRLGEKGRKKWAGAAVRVVNRAVDIDVLTATTTWPLITRLVLHGKMVVEYAVELNSELGDASYILDRVATYLQARADYVQSKILFKRALQIGIDAYGDDHPDVASRRSDFGIVLKELGDLTAARNLFEQALASDLNTFGPDHTIVGVRRGLLGQTFMALGYYQEAKEQIELALNIFTKLLGDRHSNVATCRGDLGLVLKSLGDLSGARAQFELALSIDSEVFGPEHLAVAVHQRHLGMVLRDIGDLPAAREQCEHALAIDLKVYGPGHPEVAHTHNILGSVLQDMGELNAARTQFECAIDIDLKIYGPDHCQVARDRLALGGVLFLLGRYIDALDHGIKALKIIEQSLPADHPNIIVTLSNLAACHAKQGNHGQAAELRARAQALKAQRQAKGLDG
ncbi:MAG: toll/interleukin-1 receptor domain-containing protein [Desulfarculus sp.]|nr:toll/interleukin-1 receptor domain-containing protein [Desulfarculus sp.]